MAGHLAGALYLIPNSLGDGELKDVLPITTVERLRSLRYFIAEDPKIARQLLKRAVSLTPLQEIQIRRLDEHTPAKELPELLLPIASGMDGGLVSDAGCPVVADPGYPLVRLAHERGIKVVPLVGPSAITLALMASGMDGQRFAFHGYLPIEEGQLATKLRDLERESRRFHQTQIFIETPYRNDRMLGVLLRSLSDATFVCVATNLSLSNETVLSRTVRDWRRETLPRLKDQPSVFLLAS